MGRRPAYYYEIDERLTQIERNQVNQMDALQEIHFLLDGTKYEKKTDGGMVGDVEKLKKKVHYNTMWRIRLTAGATAVFVVGGFFIIRMSAILNAIKEFLNIE